MLKPSPAISERRAGSTRLSREKTEKFPTPRAFASSMEAAVPGAVVSKPTPRNTVSRCGWASAQSTASIGE